MRNKFVRGRRRGEWGDFDTVILVFVVFVLSATAFNLKGIAQEMKTQNTYLKTLAEQSVELNKNLKLEKE